MSFAKGSDKLTLLLRSAKATLKGLNVELVDAEAERSEVISMPLAAPANEAPARGSRKR